MKTRLAKELHSLLTLATLLAAALTTLGCVGELSDDCPSPPEPEPSHQINFHYTYTNAGEDLLASSIRMIEIYIFDSATGILADIVTVDQADITRGWIEVEALPEGTYTFVAWGGSAVNGSHSFTARHMTDPATHSYRAVEVGSTRLVDFYMMLDHERLPQDWEGEIVPAGNRFDDLFHAIATDVTLTRGENVPVEFDFIRNTSVLKVSVTGLENLSPPSESGTRANLDPLEIFATGRNGRYRWDNTIDENARTVRYTSSNHYLTESSMAVDIAMLRLDKSRHTGTGGDPVLLHIRHRAGDSLLVAPLDIVGEIGRIRNGTGRLRYPDQESIDREDEFRINIAIEPREGGGGGDDNPTPPRGMAIRITINGWEVIMLDPIAEVDR